MNPTRLHPGHAILLLLLAVAAFLGWRAMNAWESSAALLPRFDPPVLADIQLLASVDPFFREAPTDGSSLPVTALPLSLHGLRMDNATGSGSAIIATGDGVQQVRGVGDSLDGGAVLVAIASDHVVIERDGEREALWLDLAGTEPARYDANAFEELHIPDDPEAMPLSDNPAPPPPSAFAEESQPE